MDNKQNTKMRNFKKQGNNIREQKLTKILQTKKAKRETDINQRRIQQQTATLDALTTHAATTPLIPTEISLQELLRLKSPTLDDYCNKLYALFIYINANEYKITNWYIHFECIGNYYLELRNFGYTKARGPNLFSEAAATILGTLVLNDGVKHDFSLDYLISHKCLLKETTSVDLIKIMAPSVSIFGQTPLNEEELHASIASLESRKVDTNELFKRADEIEHDLDLLDQPNNLLKTFDELPQPEGPAVLSSERTESLVESLNSIDCYISSLPSPKATAKTIIKRKYGIIRTTIDFFHDYLSLAVNIFPRFIQYLASNNTDIWEHFGMARLITEIGQKVSTAGGNVSQTACKNLWTEYSIKYRRELEIPYFPIIEFGNLGSADIWKDYSDSKKPFNSENFTHEFREICKKMREQLGITYFYLEAQSTPISRALVQMGFGLIISNTAERDAAPGYTIATAQNVFTAGHDPKFTSFNTIVVDRNYDYSLEDACPRISVTSITSVTSSTITIQNGPNCKISKFLGLSDMEVFATSRINTIKSTFGDSEVQVGWVSGSRVKIDELSLNGLIATTNALVMSPRSLVKYTQLRGAGNADRILQISIPSTSVRTKFDDILILSLKTYTDYCQADEMEQLKSCVSGEGVPTPVRLVAASSDFLASRTFSDFFATPSIYVGNNHITVTCSDTRYETLSHIEAVTRNNVFNKIINYRPLILRYITNSISLQQRKLAAETDVTLSASTYYSCTTLTLELEQTKKNAESTLISIVGQERFYNTLSYIEQKNFLKQFPNSLSTYIQTLCKFNLLSDIFEQTHNDFTKIIEKIIQMDVRNVPNFPNTYKDIYQQVINALPVGTTEQDYICNTLALFAISVATKPERLKNNFLRVLTLAIQAETTDSQTHIIFNKMAQAIETVVLINTEIKQSLNNNGGENIVSKIIQNELQESQQAEELLDNEQTDLASGDILKEPEDMPRKETKDSGDKITGKMLYSETPKAREEREKRVSITLAATQQVIDHDITIGLFFPYKQIIEIVQFIYTDQAFDVKTLTDKFIRSFIPLIRKGGKKRKTKKHKKQFQKTKKYNKKQNKINRTKKNN